MSGRAFVFGDEIDTDVLAPGRYKVRFESQSIRRETDFDVRAGETKDVEIGRG